MKQQQKGLQDFLQLCLTAKDSQDLEKLMDFFLTMEEKSNLALRYLIIKHLLEGKETQRKIAEKLNVSIAKITRGSNELKRLSLKDLEYLREKVRHEQRDQKTKS